MSFIERQERVEQILQKERFKEWLNLYEDRQEVGISCSSSACPIARYLDSQGYVATVTDTQIGANLVRLRTPDWAESFIDKVDMLEDCTPVTKSMALQFLV